jgi:hypothetical protein
VPFNITRTSSPFGGVLTSGRDGYLRRDGATTVGEPEGTIAIPPSAISVSADAGRIVEIGHGTGTRVAIQMASIPRSNGKVRGRSGLSAFSGRNQVITLSRCRPE